MAAQEVPQLENAVEVKGGKLQLSAAARQAFEAQANSLDYHLQEMDARIKANTARVDFAATWGKDKLASQGAQTVRERVAQELAALIADLPARLALHNSERDVELREALKSQERFKIIDAVKAMVAQQLDQVIQDAIANPDTLAKEMQEGVERYAGRNADKLLAAIDEQTR